MEGTVLGVNIKNMNSFEHFSWRFHCIAYCRDHKYIYIYFVEIGEVLENRKYIYIYFVEISVKYLNIVNTFISTS
jgi:hypothetical protein